MEIIETPIFTSQITKLVSDESYRRLQNELAGDPLAGDLIVGGGGVRKIRWRIQGRGKSGGFRIIYYYDKPDAIYMLFAYRKNEQSDLTVAQTKALKSLVERSFK